ncbi:MAG TPA: HAD-IIIA family hydrolase [Polyangiaceae bacterium]|nr:HAD-IIIA family hydrolase [Polyangiaceae bacterium]
MVKLDTLEVRHRARGIRLVVTDVDGVLTDAGVYYSARGEELKRFSMRDGMGVERLRNARIETAFVTRENSPIVVQRAHKLRVLHTHLAVQDKREFLARWLSKMSIPRSQVAYIGDDVNDLEAMRYVAEGGLTGAPSDAMPEVLEVSHFRATQRGGHGAFREFAELLINSQTQEHDG